MRVHNLAESLAGVGVIVNLTTLGKCFQINKLNSAQDNFEEGYVWYGWEGIFRGKTGFAPPVFKCVGTLGIVSR
jgi:hypothetical protein